MTKNNPVNPMHHMKIHLKKSGRGARRNGLAIILTVVVVFFIVIVFLAMAIEYSRLLEMKERAQTASEASSLAAVQGLARSIQDAQSDGLETAALNPGNDKAVSVLATPDNQGDLILGRWNSDTKEFQATLLAPSAAKTIVKFHENHPNGSVELFFAGFLGEGVELSALATAERRPNQPVPEQLRIYNPNGSAVLNINDGELTMNGNCVVESENPSSLTVTNNGMLQATQIQLGGDIAVDQDDAIQGYLMNMDVVPPAPAFTAPDLTGLVERTAHIAVGNEIVRLDPGHYPDGLFVDQGDYRLKGGLFLFGGNGLVLSGSAKIRSRDSIIVLGKNASFTLDGTEATLSKPLSSNSELVTWQDYSLVSSQSTTDCTLVLLNGASMTCAGIISCPSADVLLDDSTATLPAMHVGSLEIKSSATLTLGDGTPHPHTIRLVE